MSASELEREQLDERIRIFLHAHPECFHLYEELEVRIHWEPPVCQGSFKVVVPGRGVVDLPRHVRVALRRELREWQLPGNYSVRVTKPTREEIRTALSKFNHLNKKRWR